MFSSLHHRLIAICVSTVVLAMAAITLANFFTTRARTIESLNVQMQQLLQSQGQGINDWVRSKRTVAASLKTAATASDPLPFIKAAQSAGSFDDMYIGYPDKKMIVPHEMPAGYDPTSRPWYDKAVSTGGAILTAPYIDASSGKLVVTFADLVGSTGKVTAVIGGDVLLDTVVRNVGEIKPTPSSYALLINSEGVIITHPDPKLTLKPIAQFDQSLSSRMIADAAASKRIVDVNTGGRSGMLAATKIEGTDWLLVVMLDRAEATDALSAMLKSSLVIALIVMAAAGFSLSILIAKALGKMRFVRDAMEDIASGEGDLTRRLDASGRDELAQISSAFNHFVDKISSVMLDIRNASETVRTASAEIAAGNTDLSARTESQASALEETASSMEELTSTVKQNADNARQANQLAGSASEVAGKGGQVVSQVVQTMDSINASSKKIVDIISVIDGIAFQTNILALNAAVEAARAGEQGKGFAVVATEVRSLAQRSAAAAKEIKQLIDDSVEKVDAGSKLVNQAGATMDEIVDSIQRVTDIMGEITAASAEQTSGIEQVNQAIADMDNATQQNAALVEEAAAAAKSMQDQAAGLAQVVGAFKLDEAQASGSAVRQHLVAKTKPIAASQSRQLATARVRTATAPHSFMQ